MFEERNNCYTKVGRCCVDVVIFILSILFSLIIGIIIGAVTGIYATLGIGAFVTSAVILGVLIIIRIIMLLCFELKKDRKDRDNKYDCCR